jgi:CBS domain-containing protein
VPAVEIKLRLALESVAEAEPIAPFCVDPQTRLGEVLAGLDEHHGGVLVCHQGMLVGIFTERDALRALAQATPRDTPIGHLMTVSPVTAHRSTSLASAVRKMAVGGYRRLPVLDERGRPCGVVTTSGLVHYLVEQFARGIYNLPPQQTGAVPEREGP